MAPTPDADADADGTARPGTVLAGRYRLVRPLAAGGMARVWEARDEVLTRLVAVKVLHPHLGTDASFVSRFRAEARAAARLTHPSVVSVYDTCSEGGIEAIVMELVDGPTLRRHLDGHGPLAPPAAAHVAARIADALATAHRAGIVHRDIKPANVLLATNGRVVVTDFGIAKATETGDLTDDRQMLGTAKYLAPEQVEGGPVDGRTDVYALGIVLYEMVCGRVPFTADSETATALARLHQDPVRPRAIRPDLPADLEGVILSTLARRPDDRWPDAATLARALDALAAGRPLPAPAAPSPRAAPAAPGPATPREWRPSEPATAATVAAALPGPPRHPGPPPGPAGRPTPGAPPTPAPPDRPPPPSDRARPRRWRRRATVLVPALAMGAAVVLAGILLGRLRSPAAEPVAVTATAFDPVGDNRENDADAALAVDGDPATAWRTEQYRDPDVTRLKPGVGLLFRVDRERRLDALVVTSPSRGWAARAHVFPGEPGPVGDWGDPVDARTDIDGDARFDLRDRRGSVVVLWITRTDDDGRVAVAEAQVRAR